MEASFVDPSYFQMLHSSLPGSGATSRSVSPVRRLGQIGSPRSEGFSRANSDTGREISPSTEEPPPGAEFVGTDPAPPTSHGISSSAFSPNYFQRFFVEKGELGRGGKGVVLLVEHVLDGVSLGQYACKRVPVGDDHRWLEKVLVEVQLLQHLIHENLVSYRHVWLEDVRLSAFGPSVPCAFILQQYCNAGDLHNYVCGPAQETVTTQQLKEQIRRRSKGQPELPHDLNSPRTLPFDDIYSFFKDISEGLHYLHDNNFVHRDMKPNNCLLHSTSRGLRVLVSDFGEVQSENAIRMSTGATGTISYCAPEVLRRVTDDPSAPFENFTFKSDIFSLGMILYFLCFARLPYANADVVHEEREDLEQLRSEIQDWAGFDDERRLRPELPTQLYTFLQRLLAVDPAQRPSAAEISTSLRSGSIGENSRLPRGRGVVIPLSSPAQTPPSKSRSPNRSTAPSKGHAHTSVRSHGQVQTRRESFRSLNLNLRHAPKLQPRGFNTPPSDFSEDTSDDKASTRKRSSRSPDKNLIRRPRHLIHTPSSDQNSTSRSLVRKQSITKSSPPNTSIPEYTQHQRTPSPNRYSDQDPLLNHRHNSASNPGAYSHQHHLLPAPPPSSFSQRLIYQARLIVLHPLTPRLTLLLLLVFKILSLNMLCTGPGQEGLLWYINVPMILLAAAASQWHDFRWQIIALAAHLFVMGSVLGAGGQRRFCGMRTGAVVLGGFEGGHGVGGIWGVVMRLLGHEYGYEVERGEFAE